MCVPNYARLEDFYSGNHPNGEAAESSSPVFDLLGEREWGSDRDGLHRPRTGADHISGRFCPAVEIAHRAENEGAGRGLTNGASNGSSGGNLDGKNRS